MRRIPESEVRQGQRVKGRSGAKRVRPGQEGSEAKRPRTGVRPKEEGGRDDVGQRKEARDKGEWGAMRRRGGDVRPSGTN